MVRNNLEQSNLPPLGRSSLQIANPANSMKVTVPGLMAGNDIRKMIADLKA